MVLALVVFVLALVPRILNLDVFVGPDELSWVKRANNFAYALATGNFAQTYRSGHPGVTVLWAELPVSWNNRDADTISTRENGAEDEESGASGRMPEPNNTRQVVAIVNAAAVALAALMVRAAFGPGVGWVAGFLLAFDPFVLTEARAVRSEGMVTSFGTLSLLSLLLFLKKPRPRVAAGRRADGTGAVEQGRRRSAVAGRGACHRPCAAFHPR